MNGTVQNLKEAWQKMPGKTKKMIAVIAAGTIILAAAGLLVLNMGTKKGYSTLFTGMNSEDAQAVVSLLQDESVAYRYNDKNGSVQVMSDTVDKTRAELLSKGYPKSGFTYDMYRNNAGIMSTEKDKEKYTLYELQDRLGAQIGLFDGVRDAKVTIAEGGTQKYALDDAQQTDASASVVVTMDPGQELTDTKAAAIKNLIARAVKGMNFTNVSVFDAATMTEVGGEDEADSTTGTGKDVAELTSQVEKNIAGNVRRVLELMYGQGKVAVSVKGTLNMQKLIQETVQYNTPDKIDQNDKTGLLEKEETAGENTGSASSGNGGTAGADANADTPRYTNQTGTQAGSDTYSNNSAVREWLYNSTKEQRQIDPGVLENTTVGVTIDTDDTSIADADLVSLVANSAGITQEDASSKITVIRALSAASKNTDTAPVTAPAQKAKLPLPLLIAIGAGGLLLLLMIALLILSRQHLKASEEERQALLEQMPDGGTVNDSSENTISADNKKDNLNTSLLTAEEQSVLQGQDDELKKNEEILNLKMQHSLKLKQEIGSFVDENPQIAAKLIQNWLLTGGGSDGRNRGK